MSEELRPCPFCGGEAQVNTWTMHGITESRCFCSNSDCPNSVRTVALEQWNTRPIEDALNARIAELEGFIGKLIEAGDDTHRTLCAHIGYLGKINTHKYYEEQKIVEQWDALVKDWKERKE